MVDRETATVAFYDSQKRILLQDRKTISKFGEEWGFFGGSVELGETPRRAAFREIGEELEYSLNSYDFFKTYEMELFGLSLVEHLFLAEFPGYEAFNLREGDGMDLFSVEDIRSNLMLLPLYDGMIDDLSSHFYSKK